MSPSEWMSLSALLFTIGNAILLFATRRAGEIAIMRADLDNLETDFSVLKKFLMERALSEAIIKGIATRNSPIIVSEESKQWMAGLAGELRSFYQRLGRELTQEELMFEIERHFGKQIVDEVCIPHGLFAGACLLIAAEVAKGGSDD